MPKILSQARWIWSPVQTDNQYVLFVKTLEGPHEEPLRIRISASHHYALYLDGRFIERGPVHSDPGWCQYDELRVAWPEGETRAHLAILVHHARNAHIASIIPSRGGLVAHIETGAGVMGTDDTWKCLDLPMWRQDVPERGWALGYCEDYDARLEPTGWAEKRFTDRTTASWPHAVPVPEADRIWTGFAPRLTPHLQRSIVEPERFLAFQAPEPGADQIGDVSQYCDAETLRIVEDWTPFSAEAVAAAAARGANAFTFDLGRERVGHYLFAVNAEGGRTLDVSGAELLRDEVEGHGGRPWIYRKGTRYSIRYHTCKGVQRFASFSWSGFRYLHLVIRGRPQGVELLQVGCLERRAPLHVKHTLRTDDAMLKDVYELCRYTLSVSPQEHLIDCPTREQAQYWGDAVFIAQSLWRGFGEPAYMRWYLECFLHVPFNAHGQINCIYPGVHTTLLDYSLIPLIGQRFYKAQRGTFYRPEETFAKAMRLKAWYDARLDANGLVDFDYDALAAQGLRNFVDHPGVGWHNFPHPGIDRDGTSCPLNTFFYYYVQTLAEMAYDLSRPERGALDQQAKRLAEAIRSTFYDGEVLHDTVNDGRLSEGTSWQTNGLAVFCDLLKGDEATRAMRAMLTGYDRLCRCSPYFHSYFLPALRKAGLHRDALELIVREWGPMVRGGATTTWESFGGDEKDSLCHPWSTAPFLYLLGG